jgi:phosphoribosylglycinamide formyltransferase-1
MKRLAIFVSGSGTNCENIIRYFANDNDVDISLVLSNRSDAYALMRAKKYGVPTVIMPKEEFNQESKLMGLMKEYQIDFIVLAGFLLMIPDFLIRAFDHRMINIHPALLPKYGGKGMYGHHVHEAIKAAGEKETGMTVHWVSNVCDGGEIIAQYHTPLSPDDTPDDIAAKEHVLEQKYFPNVIDDILKGIRK